MDINEFSNWLSATAMSQSIQTTSWAIPSIQTVHIISLALLFASALVLSLRVAGRGLMTEPLPMVAARFGGAIWILLTLLLATGLLLITAEPGRTITNPMFYAKMIMLAVAILVTLWLASAAKQPLERLSSLHALGAVVGMLLWIGIMFAGRLIAYYEY